MARKKPKRTSGGRAKKPTKKRKATSWRGSGKGSKRSPEPKLLAAVRAARRVGIKRATVAAKLLELSGDPITPDNIDKALDDEQTIRRVRVDNVKETAIQQIGKLAAKRATERWEKRRGKDGKSYWQSLDDKRKRRSLSAQASAVRQYEYWEAVKLVSLTSGRSISAVRKRMTRLAAGKKKRGFIRTKKGRKYTGNIWSLVVARTYKDIGQYLNTMYEDERATVKDDGKRKGKKPKRRRKYL